MREIPLLIKPPMNPPAAPLLSTLPANPEAHFCFASLSHWVYPITLAKFNANATATISNQENLNVKIPKMPKKTQTAGAT